jgi:hypothetical protein
MREYYDSYDLCSKLAAQSDSCRLISQRSAWNDVRITWVAEALQLIMGLAYTYNAFTNGSTSANDMIERVARSLDEVSYQLRDVNRNLQDILQTLRELPRLVRGELEEHAMLKDLGELEQLGLLIRDQIEPQYILDNPALVRKYLDDIQIKIGGMLRYLGGVKGLMVTAPHVSYWLAGHVSLQKAYAAKDPNYQIRSPWELGFFKTIRPILTDVFHQIEAQDRDYEQGRLRTIPKNSQPSYVDKGRLYKHKDYISNPPPNPPIPVPDGNFSYRVSCPTGFEKERLQSTLDSIHLNPRWINVKVDDKQHASAISAYSAFLTERSEIVSFYNLAPQLFSKKDEILAVLEEPLNIWIRS